MPTSKLIRQILGAVSEFDKAMIVAKLKGARDRARRAHGKCEGRKAYAEREGGQEQSPRRGNCAAIQAAGLSPFARSLPTWPRVPHPEDPLPKRGPSPVGPGGPSRAPTPAPLPTAAKSGQPPQLTASRTLPRSVVRRLKRLGIVG